MQLLIPASPAAPLVYPSALQHCIADCIFCTAGRVLELGTDADSCVWLPGARLNIAECALTGRFGCDATGLLRMRQQAAGWWWCGAD